MSSIPLRLSSNTCKTRGTIDVEGVLQKQAHQEAGLQTAGVAYLNDYFHNTPT